MATSTLKWFADRGFELDVEVADEGVALRLVGVPIPVDGLTELRKGAELDRLDILFKASVEIEGEPAQLQDARIQLVTEEGKDALDIDARCEDVETGEVIPFRVRLDVAVPKEAPAAGGPRPTPTNEDDLDWEDETTLENLVVNAPESSATEEPDAPAPEAAPGSGKGLQALLDALARLDDEDTDEEAALDKESAKTDPGPRKKKPAGASRAATAPNVPPEPTSDEDDQSLGLEEEARGLLDLLVRQESLEIEEGAEVADLVEGVAQILAATIPPEAKATRLSEWLLSREEVADLYIGDEDLAGLLERW
jgi:hypothetical protein